MPHPRFPSRPCRRISPGLTARTALSLTIATLLGVQAQALTINPIWGISITNDPNAARIEADINNVITTYYDANFSDNVTLSVTINEDSTVGGAYNIPIYAPTKTYTQTIDALQSHATTLDNVAILARVSPFGNNPLTGTNTGFRMEVALAAALGLNGTTSVTTGSMTLGLTAGAAVNDNYVKQLFTHEMNEEMGTVSGVGSTPNTIDLSRYSAAGARTFTPSTAVHAYFSADGTYMGPEYFQYYANGVNPGYDFGDFNSLTLVQGYATGAYIPTVERRMLNVGGWTYTGPSVKNQTDSSPNTLVTLPISSVSTAGGVIPNTPGNDVQIIEGGGSGTVTLASSTTTVNTLTNMATATAVTINLAGQTLAAGNGAVDAGVGLIEVGAGASGLTIGASANDGTVTAGSSGAYTLGLVSANAAAPLDIKSAIVDNAGGGAVSIITLNIGKAILEGTNTYTGKTTVGNGSTLQIGNNSATGNLGGGGVEVDGTLTFNRSSPITVANSLSGAGTVIQGGAGALIITGGNTGFTGGFLVGLGSTLQVGAGGAAGDLGSAAVTNNGSLVFNRSDTFVTGNSISGIGSLTQAGSGTLSLTTTPGYSGGTHIQSGVLQIAGAATLGGGFYSVSNGAFLEYSSTGSQTYSGAISGAGGLTKDSKTSTLTLAGSNTYTGATTVNTGTIGLNFSVAGAPLSNILATTSTLGVGEGKVLITGASGKSNTQIFAGTTISSAQGVFTLSQNGATGLDVNLGPLTFTAGSAASFNGANGSNAGARFITSTGTANDMLGTGSFYNGTDWAAKDASNTYIVAYTGYTDVFTGTNGAQTVVVPNTASADVRIQENGAPGGPNTLASSTTTINSLLMNASSTASTLSMANGTLVVNGGSGVTGAVAVATGVKSLTIGSAANDGFITAGASGASTLLLISNNSSSLQGLIVNSAIEDNAGSGPVSLGVSGGGNLGYVGLNGLNTFTGNIDLANTGVLQIGGAGSLSSGNYAGSVQDSGTFDYESSATQTIAGAITGVGGLQKGSFASTLTLTGVNTYAGNTFINTGTLQISGAGLLGGGNYSGQLSGSGNFVYNSASTQTLAGSSTAFTGNVTISAGVLQVGNSNALGVGNTSPSKITVTPGATLDVAGFTNMSYGVTISGTGSSGQGALTNSVAATTAGLQFQNINLAGNATIGGVGDLYEVSGALADSLSLAGFKLTKIGTDTFWLGNTRVTTVGTIEVAGGTLSQQSKASNASAAAIILDNTAGAGLSLNSLALSLGSLTGGGAAGGNVSLGSATLTVGGLNASTAYAGIISGTGGITLTSVGAGSLALTGANTYTGATTISGGTLSFGSGALATTGAIVMNGGTLQWNGANTNDLSARLTLVNAQAATFDSNGNTVALASSIGAGTSASLVKAGAGTLILTSAETYTGGTTITAGTLQLGSASAAGSLAAGSVAVSPGATLAFGQGGAANVGNAISGSGTVAQSGAGTTTLSAASSFSGTVTVSAGTLLLSGSLGDANATVSSGAAFGGTGALGSAATQNASLTFQTGSSLVYAGGPLALNGSISFTGATHIAFPSSPVSGTQYALVDYTGSVSGASNLTSVYRGTVDTATPGVLNFDASAIGLTWRGATNANWGVLDGYSNFVRTASPATVDNFYQGDTVTFDDSSTVKSVTLNGALMPAAVIANSAGTYTLGGTGSLTGGTTVSQNGTGTLVLNTANSYTGATAVNAGTLRLGNASALGATSGVAVALGGTLDLNALTIANLILQGAGSLGNSSTTGKAYITNLTLSGDATVSDTSGQKAILLGSISGQNGSVNLAGFTLTKNGTGSLILNGVNMTGAGNIIVNAGTLQIMDDYAPSGGTQQPTTIAGTGSITVNPGASLLAPRWTAALNMTMPIVLNGGTLGSSFPGPDGAAIGSNISLTASSALNFPGGYGTVTLSGIISGGNSSTLTVTGDTNTRTFTGANTYTGNTVVSNGGLTIGGAGSLGSGAYAGSLSLASITTFKYASSAAQTLSGSITGAGALTQAGSGTLTISGNSNSFTGATTASSGTLLVSGSIAASTVTVNTGAEVGGTGALGATTIQSGGTILPGTSFAPGLLGTGNLTLSAGGHLAIELGGVSGTGTPATLYSELNVTGTVSLAGDVQITLFPGYSPTVGDTFYVILNDGSDGVTGAFSNAPGGFFTSGGIQYGVNYQANGDAGAAANDVSLSILAVPEPNAGFLALSGFALTAGFGRRRARR